MGLQLHETMYGKNFFEYQLPKLIEALEKIAESKTNKETIPTYPFPLADKDTCNRLLAVMSEPEKAEKFARAFCEQFEADGEAYASMGFHMARAMLNNNIEEFLVAVVGWTSKSLLNITETGSAYPQEVKPNET